MPLLVKCSCGKQLRVPDEAAGRKIKCPGCESVLTVPAGEEPATSAPARVIRFDCSSCGQTIQARTEMAGKQTRCPKCKEVQAIPGDDEDDAPTPATRIRTGKATRGPAPDEDEDDRPRRRSRSDEGEDDRDEDEDEKPRSAGKKGKKAKKKGSMLPLLLAGGAIGLVLLMGCGGLGLWWMFSGGGSSDIAKFVPGDGQGLVSVRFAEVWNNPAVKKGLQNAKQQNPGMADPETELKNALGLNTSDVDRFTVTGLDFTRELTWVIVTTTKAYDQAKVKAQFNNLESKKHEGKEYFVGTTKQGAARTGVHFAGDKMLVFAPEPALKKAIEVAAKPRIKGPLDEGLTLMGGKHHIAGAFVLPQTLMQPLKGQLAGPAAGFKSLADAQSGTVTVNLQGEGADVEANVRFPDDKLAGDAKKALEGLVAMGKLFLPQMAGPGADAQTQKQLMSALDGLKFDQKGSQVSIRLHTDSIPVSGFPGAGMGPGPGPGGNPPVVPPGKEKGRPRK